jgi:Sec-independent protein secretion pathway component TatC
MSTTLADFVGGVALETRIQYGLMGIFGTLCLLAAVAPLSTLVKAVTVAALFGLTAGIWISHLIQTVQKAADEANR